MIDRPARVVRELAAILAAHAVGIVALSYCHHFTPAPTRQLWFILEFVTALLLWLPARLFISRYLVPGFATLTPSVRWNLAGLSIGVGVFLVLWWGSPFADTLWLHRVPWQQPLRIVLQCSEMLLVGLIFASLALAVLALDRRLFPAMAVEQRTWSIPRIRLVDAGIFVALMAVANAFTVWYVQQERTVYYWDFMVYWNRTAEFAATLHNRNLGAIGTEFSQSVRNDDYGLTPAAAPAVVVALFGDTRLVYQLAIVNLYLASVAVVVWQFVVRFVPAAGWFGVAVPLVVTLLCPICWMPLIRGYLDIGGVAIVIAILGMYLGRPVTQLRLAHVVSLIALLTLLALFRRWYCFFIVAFFLLAGIDATVAVIRGWYLGGWRGAKVAGRGFWSLGLMGVGLVTTLSIVATPWVHRVLTTNYADAYTAYKSSGSFGDRLLTPLMNCGWGQLVAVGIGLGVLAFYRDTRRVGLFVFLLSPIMLLHFVRTQDMGTHHDYLLLPMYLLIPSLAVVRLLGTSPLWLRGVAVLGIAGLLGVSMNLMFWPTPLIEHSRLLPIVSPLRYPPLVRDDLPELRQLLRYVDQQAAAENGRVAVISSSPTLNTTTVQQANRSLQESLFDARRVLPTQEVDRVNGFPTNLFRASIVVVATPPQTHLNQEEQQLVLIPTELLVSRKSVGRAFEKLPESFALSGGVMVNIYHRTRAITVEEFADFCSLLKLVHPETASFYIPPGDIEAFLKVPTPPRN